jgi:hypothetical protein
VAVLKVDVRGKIVAVSLAVRHQTYDTPATAGMLATARIPAAGTRASSIGTARECTTSTAKKPATAGSVWKSYKSDCECGTSQIKREWQCAGAAVLRIWDVYAGSGSATLKCRQTCLSSHHAGCRGSKGLGGIASFVAARVIIR